MKNLATIILFFAFAINAYSQSNAVKPAKKTEEEKIEHMIQTFASLEGAFFVYNNHKVPVAESAEYFRNKIHNMEKQDVKIKTAADFVVKIASKSANTGHLYTYILSSGEEAYVGDYMMKLLDEM